MTRTVYLSTSDNPYNPITDYDNWRQFDTILHDYNTDCYFDRICKTTNELSDELYAKDIEDAVDEAVKLNLISWFYEGVNYVKVVVES